MARRHVAQRSVQGVAVGGEQFIGVQRHKEVNLALLGQCAADVAHQLRLGVGRVAPAVQGDRQPLGL